MKEFITVYLFYLVGSDISLARFRGIGSNKINWDNGIGTALYAFTPRKDMAKQFKEMRDMKKFEMRKLVMDSHEYEKFNDNYGEFILSDFPYKICTLNGSGKKYKLECTYILSTEIENTEIHENSSSYLLSMITRNGGDNGLDLFLAMINNGAFRKKYQKILDYMFGSFDSLYEIVYPYEMSEPTGDIDEASLFIHVFHNTFKEGSEIKCESLSFIKNQRMI